MGTSSAITSLADTVRGFAYANGKLINVDFPGPDGAIVHSLNDRRQAVGLLGKQLKGFAYFQGKINTVVFPDAYYTFATGINLNGDIVGYYGGPAVRVTDICGLAGAIS